MTSTFHSIETAKRSLFTQMTALNTTAHNISNANTAGFSRQVVNMKAAIPMEAYGLNRSTAPGQLGTGVEFSSIKRIRESFLDTQFRGEAANQGSWSIQADTLNKLETIFNEPSDSGIRSVMERFWKSWSDLSKDPENVTARSIVKENALAMTDAFNTISKQLTALGNDLATNVDVKANEAQSYLTSIGDLNKAIAKIEGLGDQANDLRDQRDLFVDKLSKIMNVNVTETAQGYNIDMGGQNLLTGYVVTVPVDGNVLNAAFQAGNLTGGEAFGMIKSNEVYVADYKAQLNNLARTMAEGDVQITIPKGSVLPEGTVLVVDGETRTYSGDGRTLRADLTATVKGLNGLHQLGYSLATDPATGKALAGEPFFTFTGDGDSITAGNITLNPNIVANPGLITSSLRVDANDNAVKGNNTLALLMSQLNAGKFNKSDDSPGTTLDSYYAILVGQLGVQSQEAARQADNAATLVTQVDVRRQSVSGVSLDEEMSEMMKFQHAYNAAARFMTTFDEMLDKLINSTGVVGR